MRKASLLFLITMLSFAIKGQELSPQVLSSGGEYFNSGAHSVSWTLGELAIETFEQDNTILQQGFQIHETGKTNSLESLNSINTSFYPNPVQDRLTIKFGNSSTFSGELRIYNLVGNLIIKQKVNQATELKVNLENYPASVYVVQLADYKDNSIIIEKIIKQ